MKKVLSPISEKRIRRRAAVRPEEKLLSSPVRRVERGAAVFAVEARAGMPRVAQRAGVARTRMKSKSGAIALAIRRTLRHFWFFLGGW